MNIRRPYAAGSFYPGTAEALRKTVQAYLDGAELPSDLPVDAPLARPLKHGVDFFAQASLGQRDVKQEASPRFPSGTARAGS